MRKEAIICVLALASAPLAACRLSSATASATDEAHKLSPWETVDEKFKGCAGG